MEAAMYNQPNTRSTTDDENALAGVNQDILQAEEDGLKGELAPHLHEDFTIVRANGVKQNQHEYLAAVEANAKRGRSAETPEIHSYGDCAVVRVRVSTSKNPDGTEVLRHFWNTRVFVRQAGDWRCVAWQVTEIPQA
jgi:hypothetical protein